MREGLSFGYGREMHEKRRAPSDGDAEEEAQVHDRATLARLAREAVRVDTEALPKRAPYERSEMKDEFPKRADV